MTSIRQEIDQVKNEYYTRVKAENPMAPREVNDWLSQLSVLIGNIGDELANAENDAKKIKADYLKDPDMSDAKAQTFMQASDEYKKYHKLKYYFETTKLLIQSMKRRETLLQADYENKYQQ